MVSFIDKVIVKIEEEEKHNKIAKEVVKRLIENNFYVKIEKEKIKAVLDWLIFSRIKNVLKTCQLL